MKKTKKTSRRGFVKSSAITSAALFSGGALNACAQPATVQYCLQEEQHFSIPTDVKDPATNVAGLLFSQVGYNLGLPVKIIVRLPEKGLMAEGATCKLKPYKYEKAYEAKLSYWGEIWKSHWWIAEFADITEAGEWAVEVEENGKLLARSNGLKVGENLLWKETYLLSSVDILEKRMHFTGVGAGWQDAGALWAESPAQSAMIISLEDMLLIEKERLDDAFKNLLYKQIMVGCDYLIMTQKKAEELGHPEGGFSHDILGHEEFVLANDATKAVVALWRAADLLPEANTDKKKIYAEAASKGMKWLINHAKPTGNGGYNLRQRGLPEGLGVPSDEWLTRDLMMKCWAAFETAKHEGEEAKAACIALAKQIMSRQITKGEAEQDFYGHFREFDSLKHSEKAWCHAILHSFYGADSGGLYPNYLMPFVEMLKKWGDHEDAPKWKETLKNYAYGYLVPVCKKSPFGIIPNGIFGKEGPIWFAGPFHGTNTIYGFTAALAVEMSEIFGDAELKQLAYDNLLWLSGLNAGITNENLKQSLVYKADVPDGVALPASMIHAVGNRTAGTWFGTRGVICNGFSAGAQFKMDIDATKENDGPFSFTDEDWIPHSAGWISGMMRLVNYK